MSKNQIHVVALALGCVVLALVSYIFYSYKRSDRCYQKGELVASEKCLVTINLLLSNPEKFNGREVTIRGIFGLAFEGHYIRDGSSEEKLWFEPLPETSSRYRNTCGLVGEVKGTFFAGHSGHLGMYPGLFQESKIIKVIEEKAYNCYSESEFN